MRWEESWVSLGCCDLFGSLGFLPPVADDERRTVGGLLSSSSRGLSAGC